MCPRSPEDRRVGQLGCDISEPTNRVDNWFELSGVRDRLLENRLFWLHLTSTNTPHMVEGRILAMQDTLATLQTCDNGVGCSTK